AGGGRRVEGEAVRSGGGVGLEEFDGGYEREDLEPFDFVIEPADPGLGEFHLAPWLGGVLRHFLDELHDGVAVIEGKLDEFLLSFGGGGNSVVDAREYAVLAGGGADAMGMLFGFAPFAFVGGGVFPGADAAARRGHSGAIAEASHDFCNHI